MLVPQPAGGGDGNHRQVFRPPICSHPADVILINMGYAHFQLDDNDAAIGWLLQALQTNPRSPIAHAYLAMAYALKGDDARARETAADLYRIDPSFKLTSYRKTYKSPPAGYKERWEKKLLPAARKAGLPE